ncbi:pyridinium-3,5-biscarboxylic acid mononucleotide synthase [Candidatus Hakubella thermalkaliphila]|uniref:Pyridinium-3,5-biscarboxylic acid mononucleotide synthase n=1 Tax=Candidatus Hakubella thermalkaliphila TaxID=2754717 RepID=A0A6V8NN91_9ACTN|nr:nickel pincer cofactor biosynthesis protein LarB [Candidatus Hakubella thermalkaliphila]MBT9170904.1 N5-carboxyaminoimidazole ribonucleotide mutase [Actinomycetota bacterium]GFP21812.1 pyridinium-3,5-biscarboxylic acid mononucleotide synthase [Candidatus Hakubella thermalkaliphila]GFP41880.1 pyridinium-3,5-biscarboxylic acid mononucleotide synthase [Candidatus Hakubella thermalkaliphila]
MEEILRALVRGEIDIAAAKQKLNVLQIKKIGDVAKLDVNRARRTGVPEAILAQDKQPEDVCRLSLAMAEANGYALITRVKESDLVELEKNLPEGYELEINRQARTCVLKRKGHVFAQNGRIGVLAAGTADIGVAEEVVTTARVMGCEVIKAYDVGVAGIHRLYEPLTEMLEKGVAAIVVVAGMDAVLPIVVSSHVSVPVVGVPTSVGYGMGKDGVAGLLTMLQTCSPGLAVVNIDNGFGAGVFASLIARQARG